jgi:hypothetical protein
MKEEVLFDRFGCLRVREARLSSFYAVPWTCLSRRTLRSYWLKRSRQREAKSGDVWMQVCVRCGEVSGQRAFLYSGSSRLSSLDNFRVAVRGRSFAISLKLVLNFWVGLGKGPKSEDRSFQIGRPKGSALRRGPSATISNPRRTNQIGGSLLGVNLSASLTPRFSDSISLSPYKIPCARKTPLRFRMYSDA